MTTITFTAEDWARTCTAFNFKSQDVFDMLSRKKKLPSRASKRSITAVEDSDDEIADSPRDNNVSHDPSNVDMRSRYATTKTFQYAELRAARSFPLFDLYKLVGTGKKR